MVALSVGARHLLACLAGALALLLCSLAVAQEPSEVARGIVEAAREAGVEVIVIQPGARAESTPAEAAETDLPESLMMTAQERFAAFRVTLRERLKVAPATLEEVLFILNAQSPTGHYSEYFRILFWTLAILLAAEAVVRMTFHRSVIRPWLRRQAERRPVGYSGKLPVLVGRAALEIVSLLLVVLVSYLIGYAVFGPAEDGTVRLTVAYIYLAYFTARALVFLWRMILAPDLEAFRIPPISTPEARRLYLWLLVLATLSVVILNALSWLAELGTSYNVNALLSSGLTLFMVVLNIAMVLANRRTITRIILGGRPIEEASLAGRLLARLWAPVVIAYFIVAWAEMSYRLIEELPLGISLIAGFYLILLSALVAFAVVSFVIERVFRRRALMQATVEADGEAAGPIGPDEGAAGEQEPEPDAEPEAARKGPAGPGMRTFEDLSRRVAGIAAFAAGLWAVISIWHFDLGMVAEESRIDRAIDIAAILFIGYVLYHAVRIWIDQKIEEEGGEDVEVAPGDEGGAGGASRLATLLPLFRNVLLTVIAVAVAMVVLTNLGINVSAFIAGAGVVGLAIGFGAQTLVRDIFSGAFFLIDDAFRKGEYIDVGSVKGTVEKISLRSMQLRHHLGPLHTIPFGEIQHLTNFSRDWVMMKLPLRVTYDTDVERVRKLIKKLGQQLAEDPVIGHQFLQPLKSQGVIEMQDSAMIIRVKFMCRPGDQWVLRKRVYQEIRDLFAREGIRFAHREVTVRIAGDSDGLTEAQKQALGAAALGALDEDDNDADMGEGSPDER